MMRDKDRHGKSINPSAESVFGFLIFPHNRELKVSTINLDSLDASHFKYNPDFDLIS